MRWTQSSPGPFGALVVAGLAVHAAHGLTGFGGPLVDWLVVQALYYVLMVVAVGVCAFRAYKQKSERRAWACIAAGIAAWALGELSWSVGLGNESGDPMIGDVGYLAYYPLVLAGCAWLAADHDGRRPAGSWLDALAASLAISAVGTAVLLDDVFSDIEGQDMGAMLAFAYPTLDIMLIALVIGSAASQGWRLERRWAVLGAGLMLGGVANSMYYAQITAGTYVEGGLLDTVRPMSALMLALASVHGSRTRPLPRTPTLLLPLGLAFVSLTILVIDHFRAIPTAAIALACGALIAVLGRALLAFRENEAMLSHSQVEALTDGLTDLPNRRALSQRLDALLAQAQPTTLLLFDLDGFKLYNDTFGHPAGDALLVRLAGRLSEAVEGEGTAYRMGGDEFCVLLPGDDASSVRVELALRESGEGFDVGASFGTVALPRETLDATEALRIVDQRLYAGKERRRASAGAQASDALLRVLGEREPDLHEHLHDVALLATTVAAELGLGLDEIAEIRRAAELHDIGKVALPDLVLQKPGPLAADERTFVEQHTIIGERILAAAPALRAVGRIVRASHERWDGAGYPDGLVQEDIPMGARIIAVCDAYDAMITVRPYQGAVPTSDALSELRRCAGTQFDPTVVTAFTAMILAEPQPLPEPQPLSLSSRSMSST